ncbi:hypothetical protein ACFZDG_33865 [Kitasatospora xanthocidica]|uniref:hypothetical protein n=1 Tax=Kitasatospora xanthocidica TaxID=83382 RepID=UPI0036E48789
MEDESLQHRGRTIVVAGKDQEKPRLLIDGQEVEHVHRPKTGRYATALLPYTEYDSLAELGKAVVDHVPHFQPRI